jgi:hypothetical protein
MAGRGHARGGARIRGASPSVALAKREKLSARIGGKHFKAKRFTIVGGNSSGIVTIAGGKASAGIGGGSAKFLSFSCAANLAGATFPLTVDCAGLYTQSSVRRFAVTSKAWSGGSGLQVTFQSFDGTRVTGAFSGGWPAGDTNSTDPPLNVQGGRFAVEF